MPRTRSSSNNSTANLWLAADKLRSNMEAAEYKQVLGLDASKDPNVLLNLRFNDSDLRMANRMRSTSTFENRQSKFA